ncbi:probable elongation factor 1-delta isoform X2 [Fopius arisanus]|uniref:Probable elongation factor 1-delta isoform X2 n=1 Tax=Fopius arisanus TaxID=64838 RepID=A0A9R1TFT5_9HYME|nr:PREDICTED: probable elongation factor 1-delta isoform X2 [Fopius arisanus]
MPTTALAQEKVWVTKSAYDKAESAHFERLAKVVSHNIMERYPSNPKSLVSTNQQEILTNHQTKSSSKKSKEKKNKADKKNKYNKDVKNEDAGQKEPILIQESRVSACAVTPASGSLANEVAKARQHIKKGLQCVNNIAADVNVSLQDLPARVAKLEKDNHDLRNTVAELRALIEKLDLKVNSAVPEPYIAICPAKPQEVEAPGEDDNEVDLFGSDSEGEDAEAAKIREERLAAYNAKKSKKPALIAKSNIILDIKPWDDETDMGVMQAEVRKIATDGLLWGAAKLVPLAFGISKLQISCVVEDDKVSIDWLTETIQELEEYVQSVDIAAFNKV